MPTLRWLLSLDNGVAWQEISPANGADLKIAFERDLDRGQIFFRRTLKGDVVFGGRDRKADYDLFWHGRRVPSMRCNTYLLRLEDLCSNTWKTLWAGKFSRASGTFDHDRCTYTVSPKTVDRYTCLIEAMDRKVNLLTAPAYTVNAYIVPSLELTVCVTVGFTVIGCAGVWDGINFFDEWDAGHSQAETAGAQPYQLNAIWRERVVTECIGGSPSPPPGAGWVMLTDNCGTSGTAIYVRNASIAWSFGDLEAGTMSGADPVPPNGDCDWVLVGIIDESTIDPMLPPGSNVPWYVCFAAGTPIAYKQARRLGDAITVVLDKSGCDVAQMASDFLDYNAPGDAFGYAPGVNYVTASPSEVNNLFVLQKSDALDPNASNPATIGEATLAELLDMLRATMQLFWDVDELGRLRIEHWSYWQGTGAIDIRDFKHTEPLRFQYLDRETPRRERLLWTESLGRDFVGVDLLYDQECVGPDVDEALEHRAGQFMSDIAYVATGPDNLTKQGFVLLAARRTTSDFTVINGYGALTGNFITNAPLSTANLQDRYWRHNRLLPSGTMNDTPEVFDGFMPTAEQKDVTSALCCAIHTFDPSGEIITGLSELLTAEAVLEQAEYSIRSGVLSLTLRYAI